MESEFVTVKLCWRRIGSFRQHGEDNRQCGDSVPVTSAASNLDFGGSVIPAQAEIQIATLDSRARGYDKLFRV